VRHPFFASTRPLVFAHRGGSALAPENTMPAFDNGLAHGADGLELDVHLSRDGVVVVHHDRTLDRTTSLRGPIAERATDELRRAAVPTLGEVLARHREPRVIIELKVNEPELAERAVGAGVRRDGILVDPTHDFGKNTRHSLELTRRLDELVATGWPVLVALSNKDFVGETLDLPAAERLPGTLAATAVSAWLGARVFRAHNVAETRQALDMFASVKGVRQPAVSRRGLA